MAGFYQFLLQSSQPETFSNLLAYSKSRLNLNPASPIFGSITATPKPGWSNTDILGQFRRYFNVPMAFNIDVNAAAFGKYHWLPEDRGIDAQVYFTKGKRSD
ncbi:MAG: ROK family protein [Anaerolineales bacterium]